MDKKRVKLTVYVDLDDAPGTFHSIESARNAVANLLMNNIPHYNPMVSAEGYSASLPSYTKK